MLRTTFSELFKNTAGSRRRKHRSKRASQPESLESRLVLSAVSLEAGTLIFDADPSQNDEVTIEDTGTDTLRITVGATDTFVLDAAITANPAFTLSAGNTVLDIDLAAAGIVEAEFNLNDGDDSFVATSAPESLLLAINGGEGNDVIDASTATGSVVVAGGAGNDILTTGSGNDTLIGGDGDDELRAGDGDDQLIAGGQITITITNLQSENGALLTPFFLATQDGAYDFFDVGGTASQSLERLAEDGTTGPRIDAALNSGGVNEAVATPGGPIQPGETRTVTLDANSLNQLTQYLSYASMVIPSNDAFVGNDSPLELDLFDANGNLIRRTGDNAFVIDGNDVYDAGTEVNDEIPENTAALAQAAPNTGVTENGVIRLHEGFQGSQRLGGAVGNILTARPNADFTVPGALIASIQVDSNDGNDLLEGGAGNDELIGGSGNDILRGGDGDDIINGGDGDDTAHGDEGNDFITGGSGNDTVVGGSDDDSLEGGEGDDTLIGGFGDDFLDGGEGDDRLVGGGQIEITVTNLQTANGALLTPFFLATQNGVYDFFDVGGTASENLERLAEDGTTGPRIDAALASGGVNEAKATDGGPIVPGASRTVTFYADSVNELTQYLSFASMVIPSNDAFIGNDSPLEIDLFDENGNLIQRVGDGAFIVTGNDVYDAGTEVNDEVPENTAALAQAAPNTGVTEGGVIRQHEGFQGSERFGGAIGNVLTARPNADFTVAGAQIASIQVGVALDGDDILIGGLGDDILEGSEGDDFLEGGEGNDELIGGIGNDLLFGDEGDDILAGGGGTDAIDGGEGNDTNSFQGIGLGVTATVAADGSGTASYGGVNETFTGIENLTGSDNNDVLIATGAAANILIGGAGDDILAGGGGTDTIDGGEGNDTNSFQGIGLGVTATVAADGSGTASYGGVNETFTGIENLTGSDNNDVLIATGAAANILIGGAGDDILAGGGGTDTIDGGEGNDTNSFQGIGLGVTATVAADGSGTASYGGVNETFTGIENLTGSDNNDVLTATGAAANILIGGAGDDILAGGGGTDIIDGGEGNDTNSFQGIGLGVTATLNADGSGTAVYGAVSEEFVNIENLLGSENDDVLTAVGEVSGTLNGAGGNDVLTGGIGTVLIGGDGIDTTSVDLGDQAVFVDLTNSANGLQILERNSGLSQTIEGFESIEIQTGDFRDIFRVSATATPALQQITIDAGDGNNFINAWRSDLIINATTGSGNDVIWTGIADDTVSSGGGSDRIFTNSGDDTIDAGDGNNRVSSGFGDDFVRSGNGRDILRGGGGNDILDSGAGNDRLFGSSGDDTLLSGDGNDVLFGGWGDDIFDGGDGNDLAFGHLGNDTIEGGNGNDRLFGGFGDDTLDGGAGDDWVVGNAGNDILIGGTGNDRIWGGTGRDLLFGGSGRDSLFGGSNDDLLIAGNTTLDTSQIQSVRSEWASDRSVATRLANISDGSGSIDRVNDNAFLNASTLEADEDRDRLFGQSGIDAFFASATDRTFRSAFESLLDL